MNNKITFSDVVDLSPTAHRTITVELLSDRVKILLEDHSDAISIPANQAGGELFYETLSDVEALSVMFACEQVCVFKQLVKLLGKVHVQADALKGLMV